MITDITVSATPNTNRNGLGFAELTVDVSALDIDKIVSIMFSDTSNHALWLCFNNGTSSSPTSLSVCLYRLSGTYSGQIGATMRIFYVPKN